MRKKILIIGPNHSGKAKLAHYLNEEEGSIKKRGSIVYGKYTISVPSSYLESPDMRKHIISLRTQAHLVLMLYPLMQKKKVYPPNFAKVFNVSVMGVLTFNEESPSSSQLQQIDKMFEEIKIMTPYEQLNLSCETSIESFCNKIRKKGE